MTGSPKSKINTGTRPTFLGPATLGCEYSVVAQEAYTKSGVDLGFQNGGTKGVPGQLPLGQLPGTITLGITILGATTL